MTQPAAVDVDGIDVRQVDPAELRAQLALVPQQPTLFAASARDNIRYGRLQASDAEVEDAACRRGRCFPARVAAGL